MRMHPGAIVFAVLQTVFPSSICPAIAQMDIANDAAVRSYFEREVIVAESIEIRRDIDPGKLNVYVRGDLTPARPNVADPGEIGREFCDETLKGLGLQGSARATLVNTNTTHGNTIARYRVFFGDAEMVGSDAIVEITPEGRIVRFDASLITAPVASARAATRVSEAEIRAAVEALLDADGYNRNSQRLVAERYAETGDGSTRDWDPALDIRIRSELTPATKGQITFVAECPSRRFRFDAQGKLLEAHKVAD